MSDNSKTTALIREELIRDLHNSDTKLALAISGGGSLAISDLLTVPGASQTVLAAAVPYSHEALTSYICQKPDQYCCQRTARLLAMESFVRAINYTNARSGAVVQETEKNFTEKIELSTAAGVIGVGCTASLTTDYEKRGLLRVHAAAQTLRQTLLFSFELVKGKRTRAEEERLVADFILNVIETARIKSSCTGEPVKQSQTEETGYYERFSWKTFDAGTESRHHLHEIIPLYLGEDESLTGRQTVGSAPLVDLFFGQTKAMLWCGGEIQHFQPRDEMLSQNMQAFNPQAEFTQAIYPGAFNPIHSAHIEITELAQRKLGCKVCLEISVRHADKPMLDYIELEDRLEQITAVYPGLPVWLTQLPFFQEKAEFFRETTFVLGADTLKRFADIQHYYHNIHYFHSILRMLGHYNCRFLVFPRKNEQTEEIETLRTLKIPDMLRSLSDEVSEDEFLSDCSSSKIRQNDCVYE